MSEKRLPIAITVNGRRYEDHVPSRLLLADFIRNNLRLTGTHVGCAHGVCGACTVFINGKPGRSCLAFAVQLDGAEIRTIESFAEDEKLNPIQQAFHENHALQCGFCTPGFLAATTQLLAENPDPSDKEIKTALAGQLCRCTGYVNIVRAVRSAAAKLRASNPR